MGHKGYHETQTAMQERLEWYKTLRLQAQHVLAKPALYGAEVGINLGDLEEVVTQSGVNIVGGTVGLILSYEEEAPEETVTSTITLYGGEVEIIVESENNHGGRTSKTVPVRDHAAFIAGFVKTMQLTGTI